MRLKRFKKSSVHHGCDHDLARRTFVGGFAAICSSLFFSGCSSTPTRKPAPPSTIAKFKEDTSVGTEGISIAAMGLVGVPYRFGGNTPAGGFDCSGLIVYVYNNAAGIKLPRTVQEMSRAGQNIQNAAPAPGDLVFFNTTGERYSHAGIYVGHGRFVHAPSKGGTVRLEKMTSPYWAARYTEARRIANAKPQ
jgi:cell wall-associated NlpC family hydrolase